MRPIEGGDIDMGTPRVRSRHPRNGLGRLTLTDKQNRALLALRQAWQRLALHIVSLERMKPPIAVGISSSIAGEGKTTSAIGLATAFASETTEKVLLIEGDFLNPSMAEDIGVDPAPGIAEYLLRRNDLHAAMCHTALKNMYFIPAGDIPGLEVPQSPYDLSTRLRKEMPGLLHTLKQQFTFIVMDLPPVLSDVNAEEIGRLLDGTLLVVRAGLTPLQMMKDAASLMQGEKFLGVVYLGPPSPVPRWLADLLLE